MRTHWRLVSVIKFGRGYLVFYLFIMSFFSLLYFASFPPDGETEIWPKWACSFTPFGFYDIFWVCLQARVRYWKSDFFFFLFLTVLFCSSAFRCFFSLCDHARFLFWNSLFIFSPSAFIFFIVFLCFHVLLTLSFFFSPIVCLS